MLLKTRFYIPPLRKQSVLRHELINKLNRSVGGQLIIVSAPAGYGKTTSISQWLHSSSHTFSWLSIDHLQSSPDVLLEYIIKALQNVQPGIGEEANQVLKHTQSNQLEDVIISLLNDLDDLCTNNSSEEPITLIMDDFHLAENTSTLHLMNLFFDHLPPSIRVILTSRNEPSLALARRRANNQLLELNAKDLAFTLKEGRHFFLDTMSLSLQEDNITELYQKSEGWIVGLQLAALSLQQSSRNSPNIPGGKPLDRHISDYLFEEVFSLQEEHLQNFLILTSSPPRFCAGLCNALVQRQDSLTTITHLDKLNLFLIPLDNHRTWFRYHDLFRQFLLHHFSELPADLQRKNHHSSAHWFENAGYLEEAIDQHIYIQDWDNAARLLEQIYLERKQHGQLESLHIWIDKIPGEFLHNDILNTTQHLTNQQKTIPKPTSSDTIPPPATQIVKNNLLSEPLTKREAQVMKLVSQGLPNKNIASELNISLNTLKVHIRNLYGKMGVENRSQALIKLNNHTNFTP